MSTDRTRVGFTLIELLASLAILALIMTMLFTVFEQVNKAWLNGENRVETFTQARAILDLMSRELSQAITTTNTPKEITFYGDTNRVYFVAPVNANPANQADLCEVGYEHELQDAAAPGKWTMRIRRRLTEPTAVNIASGGRWDLYTDPTTWWDDAAIPVRSFDPNREATLAANSVLSLRFRYLKRDGTPYPPVPPYRSENNNNSLPYAVVIFLDSVDSRTAARLKLVPNVGTAWQPITNSTLRSFSTTVYLPNISP
jgi:prepilin-type N-terminal cleavage/methylation domain-containing protein